MSLYCRSKPHHFTIYYKQGMCSQPLVPHLYSPHLASSRRLILGLGLSSIFCFCVLRQHLACFAAQVCLRPTQVLGLPVCTTISGFRSLVSKIQSHFFLLPGSGFFIQPISLPAAKS